MGNAVTELPDVCALRELDRTQVASVGGKAANLGELTRIAGLQVPPGFCVGVRAYARMLQRIPGIDGLLDRLSGLSPADHAGIRAASAQVRARIEAEPPGDDLAAAVAAAHARLGAGVACAVRSSATAEDLPNASFAGQQDSWLNVIGVDQVLRHVGLCWASLFTERAVAYRLRNGFGHRAVRMAVVVQAMVAPRASGVAFTADPVNGNRKVATVEACFGLGQALVAGAAAADAWKVRGDAIVERTIRRKPQALAPAAAGGVVAQAIEPARQAGPALSDAQVVRLARLARRIEAHFGQPQDIEWCLARDGRGDAGFQIVQSRPITTLFPVPAADDDAPRVYVSVGHQQMYTDPMRPLGISFRQLSNAGMREAGGRMFVDVARAMSTPSGRAGLLGMLGRGDPLIGDALATLIERGFIPEHAEPAQSTPDQPQAHAPHTRPSTPDEADPAIIGVLAAENEAALARLERDLRGRSGPALMATLAENVQVMNRVVLFDPRIYATLMLGIEASWWLDEHVERWLGEKNVADILTRSAPGNVTSQMGLALLDVADAIRPHPQVVALLERALEQGRGDGILDMLPAVPGGVGAREALQAWLDRYGMRCTGEIDITCPRWHERPSLLLPALLGHVRHAEPGAAARRFAQGLQDAREKEADLLRRLRALPDGARKAARTQRMIDRLRTFIGYREYPKYAMVRHFDVYRRALLEEADRLVRAGVLRERDDIGYLRFEELQEVVRTRVADPALIERRRQAFRDQHALATPRVLTSEGESVAGRYRRDGLPDGALVGLAVSAGTVEGRARVVHDMAHAQLEPGDILVTACTDPSWTPLFVGIAGLVTEVGGQMTHGAVIAREYGLPAVVSVEHATRLIRDGQRIRVHGAEGYVEPL